LRYASEGDHVAVRVSDQIPKAVAFIGYDLPTGEISIQGTVFFVTKLLPATQRSVIYAVTAKHVIQGIGSMGHNTCVIRMNTTDGKTVGVEVPLNEWWPHPEETEVDVAVLPFDLSDDLDHLAVPMNNFANDIAIKRDNMGIGDEVFMAGLFANRVGRSRNIPIVRIGNIAAMPDPDDKILTEMGFIEAYLIEVRSLGGLSGSPVFVNLGLIRNTGKGIQPSISPYGTNYFIGLTHGHFDMDATASDINDHSARANAERINKGIAIVVPSYKILEVLEQPMLKEAEKKAEEKLKNNLPKMDSASDSEALTRETFESILKQVSRKVPESQSKDSDK
jgi:hypothetical protein